MPLRLEITSRHRERLGERRVKEFGADGGTIGRSLESDWVLQDSQRFVSSRHASIDFRSGSYYIVDTSTNGVFVNEASVPVGRGKPQRLFDGDRLRMGEYEMLVHIVESDSTTEQLTDTEHVDPVRRKQQVDPADSISAEMLAEHEITGVGIEALLSEEAEANSIERAAALAAASLRLEDDETPPPGKPEKKPQARSEKRRASVNAETAQGAAPRSRPPSGGNPSAGTPVKLEAFFRGAGLSPRKMDEKSVELLLQRLGQIMRELVVGITEALHLRAEQKNMLRLPHTTIQPNNNNPLKFSAGVDEALMNLLFKRAPEYIPAVESVREAFQDVRIHQQALLTAMQTALIDYIERMDPEELEQKFNRGGKPSAFLGAANKMKYWDLYADLYQVMARYSPGQFPQLFAEELTRAYENEAARLQGTRPQQPPKAKAG